MKRLPPIPVGFRSGRLVATGEEVKRGNSYCAVCICDCGATHTVDRWSMLNNKTKSCGCLRLENNRVVNIKHGHNSKKAGRSHGYSSWANMKNRCLSPTAFDWKYYGGRGITVCERWLSFENFLADMGEPEPGLTIDRINNNGNYEPSNCRWATRREQRLNQGREVLSCTA